MFGTSSAKIMAAAKVRPKLDLGCSSYSRQITGAAKTTERQFVLHLSQDGGCCQGETSAVPLGARLTNTSKTMGAVYRFASVPELKFGGSPSDESEGSGCNCFSTPVSYQQRTRKTCSPKKDIS